MPGSGTTRAGADPSKGQPAAESVPTRVQYKGSEEQDSISNGGRNSGRVLAGEAEREHQGVTFEEAEEFLEGYTQEGLEIGGTGAECSPLLEYGDVDQFLDAFTQSGEEGDELVGAWGECEGPAQLALVDAGWWTEKDVEMWEEEGRRVLEQQDEGDEELPMWVFDDMG